MTTCKLIKHHKPRMHQKTQTQVRARSVGSNYLVYIALRIYFES